MELLPAGGGDRGGADQPAQGEPGAAEQLAGAGAGHCAALYAACTDPTRGHAASPQPAVQVMTVLHHTPLHRPAQPAPDRRGPPHPRRAPPLLGDHRAGGAARYRAVLVSIHQAMAESPTKSFIE